jgi:hypothetical protein
MFRIVFVFSIKMAVYNCVVNCVMAQMETKESASEQASSYSQSDGDGDVHTGQVGTALYASPEVLGIIQRTHYNQVQCCMFLFQCGQVLK